MVDKSEPILNKEEHPNSLSKFEKIKELAIFSYDKAKSACRKIKTKLYEKYFIKLSNFISSNNPKKEQNLHSFSNDSKEVFNSFELPKNLLKTNQKPFEIDNYLE